MDIVKEMSFKELNQLCKQQSHDLWSAAWDELNHRVKLAQEGNELIQMEIINDMIDMVYKLAHQFSKSCNISDFEDIVSLGTLGIIKTIKTYDPKLKCLFSKICFINIRGEITQHTAYEFKHCDKRPVYITNNDLGDEQSSSGCINEAYIVDNSKSAFDILNIKMNIEVVNEAIKKLSPKQKQAFLLQHVKGMKQRQAAEMLGVSYDVFNSRTNAARVELRKYCHRKVEL